MEKCTICVPEVVWKFKDILWVLYGHENLLAKSLINGLLKELK